MELIGKQIAIETILGQPPELHYPSWYAAQIEKLPPAPPEYLAEQAGILVTDTDTISRQAAIDALQEKVFHDLSDEFYGAMQVLDELPSAEPKQRYTEEELSVFAHGISLSLLSKRSAQHWRYDEDTATEIKFLERLYEKVCADIRGEEV